MAVTTALCNSFKKELLLGTHVFGTDTFKLALIKSGESGTYNDETQNYSDVTGNSDEIGNTGNYSAGGASLTSVAITGSNTTDIIYVDCDNVQFTSATIDANGSIIYNSSKSNKAVAIIAFSGTQSSDNGTFTVTMPAPGTGTAIIRIT